jgi:hypothetical protein
MVSNQRGFSTCVAHALTDLIEVSRFEPGLIGRDLFRSRTILGRSNVLHFDLVRSLQIVPSVGIRLVLVSGI